MHSISHFSIDRVSSLSRCHVFVNILYLYLGRADRKLTAVKSEMHYNSTAAWMHAIQEQINFRNVKKKFIAFFDNETHWFT